MKKNQIQVRMITNKKEGTIFTSFQKIVESTREGFCKVVNGSVVFDFRKRFILK